MHHPVQCARPEWGNPADAQPEQAVETRRDFCAQHADTPVLILGTHFATSSAGHIRADGDAWRFEAEPLPKGEHHA